MTLSRAEIELIIEEIEPLVGQAVVQRIYEVDPETRLLQLRRPGQTRLLLMSTRSHFTRIHFVRERPAQPERPSPLTMQLRKWLGGALLEGVEQINDDRIVRFEFDAVDPQWEPTEADEDTERAPRVRVALIVELVGHDPNWYLVDGEDVILGQLHDKNLGHRPLGRGADYQPPEPPDDPTVGSRVRLKLDALDPSSGERSARLARHYEEAIAKRRLEREKKSLRGRLTRRLERLERRIEHIEEDLERADKADEYRRRGELLQSAWGEVEPGAESVTVPDFYDESMPRVEIPLDPSASLQENIEQYFHEYQRLSSASEEIEERLAESKALRERVEEAIAEFDNLGDDIEQIEAFAQRLEDEGVLREEQPQRSGSSRDETPRKAYREFRSGRDRPILVGRGASDNDTLTTSVARGRDIWLHARDWPGAHVILRMRKDQNAPTSQDLVDAATLAAWFSDGRKDTLVDITYTRAKHVRKPKGFPPGKVTVADASTIAVAVEEERLERLLESERRD